MDDLLNIAIAALEEITELDGEREDIGRARWIAIRTLEEIKREKLIQS